MIWTAEAMSRNVGGFSSCSESELDSVGLLFLYRSPFTLLSSVIPSVTMRSVSAVTKSVKGIPAGVCFWVTSASVVVRVLNEDADKGTRLESGMSSSALTPSSGFKEKPVLLKHLGIHTLPTLSQAAAAVRLCMPLRTFN